MGLKMGKPNSNDAENEYQIRTHCMLSVAIRLQEILCQPL